MTNREIMESSVETAFGDPDCLKCMRTKLRAESIVIFFHTPEGWRISNFQGEKPADAAEIDFCCMLDNGVPEEVERRDEGVVLNTEAEVAEVFGSVKELFVSKSVVAAPVKFGDLRGIRLATRDSADPFSRDDLVIIQCVEDCPEGCEPLASRVFSEIK